MTIEQRQTYTSVEMGGRTAGVEECRNGRVGMYRSERLRAILLCNSVHARHTYQHNRPLYRIGRHQAHYEPKRLAQGSLPPTEGLDWTGLDWDACELASG